VIAHVGGLPVEEVLPALMSGVGAWLIQRLTSLGTRVPSWASAREHNEERQPADVFTGVSGSGKSSVLATFVRCHPRRSSGRDFIGASCSRPPSL
jgi:hypothetical protein